MATPQTPQIEYLANQFLKVDQFRVSSDDEIYAAVALAIEKARQELDARLDEFRRFLQEIR